jgi:maleate cis-trans isomerase
LLFLMSQSSSSGISKETRELSRIERNQRGPHHLALEATILELQSLCVSQPLLITQYTAEVNDPIKQYFADAGLQLSTH